MCKLCARTSVLFVNGFIKSGVSRPSSKSLNHAIIWSKKSVVILTPISGLLYLRNYTRLYQKRISSFYSNELSWYSDLYPAECCIA